MPQYESLVNAAEFISDHFLTSDDTKASFLKEVKALRKQWNEAAKESEATTHTRFTAARSELVTQLAGLADAREETIRTSYARLREILGFPGDTHTLTTERSGTQLSVENVWAAATDGGESPQLLWLEAEPAESIEDAVSTAHPIGAVHEGESPVTKTLGSLISDLYLTEAAPQYIAVMAGRFLILTERERWPEGRFLAADAQLVAERNETKQGGEIDYLLAIFGRDSLHPGPDGTIWWHQVLEESLSHAVAVSQDLREGIRRSIEIIANDVLTRRENQGLDNTEVDGNDLARQALRYLYRILFLLYAEASPELRVLPVGVESYDSGYGLERLRELIQNDLNTPQAQAGTHFYQSLDLLFALVNGSHPTQQNHAQQRSTQHPTRDNDDADHRAGLDFQPLRADLFDPARTAAINQVQLSNEAMQDVLTRLLLSGEKRGTQRGFVSYASLGINQLGAVYEGLMSYSGFIAAEDLHEVAPGGDPTKGSWVVPTTRSEGIEAKDFVTRTDPDTGIKDPALHRRGSFVFRLAGRERQQSASYYTPEVLTRFVVSQALEELLDQPDSDGEPRTTTAQDILQLSVCEPALGSGAFAIEAVRQLAEEYLTRRQAELGEQIPAEDYPLQLQKVKAQIALHQVHGVDLNATAVELAEVSLWLDTMSAGLQAPWFGLRLRRGNSLVGARRATYSVDAVNRKAHLNEEPAAHPLAGLVEAMEHDGADPAAAGRIHHFLLPGEGWGAAAGAKEVKALAGENQKALKAWQREIKTKLTKTQINRLRGVSERVEVLWQIALRRLQVAESEARRDIDYWGKPETDTVETAAAVTREEIEAVLNDPEGIYQRLDRVMDAWTALWFWPVVPDGDEQPLPPSVDEWITALEGILGTPIVEGSRAAKYRTEGQQSLLSTADWNDLNSVEEMHRTLSGMKRIDDLSEAHPWLETCEQIADEQGFFHWELAFATVFARGGFDLQIGNPPWVRPDWDEKSIYAEHDPWWQLASKPSQAEKDRRQQMAQADGDHVEFMCASARDIASLRAVLSADSQYPIVAGLRPDLYRSFMERTWRSAHMSGTVGLIHPESHFTEKKAGHLRSETYRRLRRHWQFVNEMKLFEIDNHVTYGIHVYGSRAAHPRFVMAASLYHPDTVERSMRHEGGTEVPGLKDGDGNWDIRPHAERILTVNSDVLETWASILDEPGTPAVEARMVYPVNRASESVLEKLAAAPRVRELGLQYSSGWNETTDRRNGYFEVGSAVNESWDDVILQGPHFSVATPFAKQPNPTMRNNLDWSELDLEALPEDFIPRTSYQPNRSMPYDQDYGTWRDSDGVSRSVRMFHRIAIREYVGSVTGVRTLQPALIPPGTAHIHAVNSYGFASENYMQELGYIGGLFSSLSLDFMTRLRGQAHITSDAVLSMPNPERTDLILPISDRFLTLSPIIPSSMRNFERNALQRYRLLIELDALAAIGFGLTADELCTIYRTQFPVLRGYEQDDLYDANGRKVPKDMNRLYRKSGESGMAAEDLRWTHPQSGVEYTYEFPFRSFDREEDMRAAYTRFESELG